MRKILLDSKKFGIEADQDKLYHLKSKRIDESKALKELYKRTIHQLIPLMLILIMIKMVQLQVLQPVPMSVIPLITLITATTTM
jgi:hypothetical protein